MTQMWKLRFAVALLTTGSTQAQAAVAPPPAIPIVENDVVSLEGASLEFHVPNFPIPILVAIHTAALDGKRVSKLEGIDISYGPSAMHIGAELIADITAPDLLQTRATALHDSQGRTVIGIYLFQTTSCDQKPGCGHVAFDWVVGGKVEKLDYR